MGLGRFRLMPWQGQRDALAWTLWLSRSGFAQSCRQLIDLSNTFLKLVKPTKEGRCLFVAKRRVCSTGPSISLTQVPCRDPYQFSVDYAVDRYLFHSPCGEGYNQRAFCRKRCYANSSVVRIAVERHRRC